MSDVKTTIMQTITSSAGAAVNGDPIRAGGSLVEVQFFGPAANHGVEVSEDALTWAPATDPDGLPITNIAAGYRILRERPMWVRPRTSAVAVNQFTFAFNITKPNQ